MDFKYLKGLPDLGGGAYTCKSGELESTVFIKDIKNMVKKPENFPLIAHEVMHVIQQICEKFGMTVETEQEHTAYMMSYILNQLLGYDYETT